jgi:hypothetical protein
MADVESELDESDESNKDEDELGRTINAFATLLTNINDVNGTNKIYFTLVTSLLS